MLDSIAMRLFGIPLSGRQLDVVQANYIHNLCRLGFDVYQDRESLRTGSWPRYMMINFEGTSIATAYSHKCQVRNDVPEHILELPEVKRGIELLRQLYKK